MELPFLVWLLQHRTDSSGAHPMFFFINQFKSIILLCIRKNITEQWVPLQHCDNGQRAGRQHVDKKEAGKLHSAAASVHDTPSSIAGAAGLPVDLRKRPSCWKPLQLFWLSPPVSGALKLAMSLLRLLHVATPPLTSPHPHAPLTRTQSCHHSDVSVRSSVEQLCEKKVTKFKSDETRLTS